MSNVIREFKSYRKKQLKGETGAQGLQGSIGQQGLQGLQGSRGNTGDKGDKGDQGDRGERGVQGVRGLTGTPPEHRWDGTKLAFQSPNGVWGEYVELQGKQGEDGKTPNIPNIPKVFSTSIDAVQGLRAILSELQAENMQYDKLIDTVGDYKYIGEALPGTTSTEASWRIKRIDLSDTGGDIEIIFADGVSTFTKVWDDHLSYDYNVG